MSDGARVLLHTNVPDGLADRLHSVAPDAQVQVCDSYAGLPDILRTFAPQVVYTVRFDGTPGYPRDALFAPGGPLWIANGGVGTDHFGTWDAERVTVTNAAGVAAEMMAEYVIGGFLHFTLDVAGLKADQTSKTWRARTVRPLKGQTLLIVGLGRTGAAIAERARAFGMHVIGTRAHPRDMAHIDEVYGSDELAALLPRADFIAVAAPLTARTAGMIGVLDIALMKEGAVLADVSRGGVVDQTALCAALRSGKIAGAALDVFEVEPLPRNCPLWTLENVILSPHCSSVFDGWEHASFDLFLDNLLRWRAGAPLLNIVDPERGY